MRILLAIYLSRVSRLGKREMLYSLHEFEWCRLGFEAYPSVGKTMRGRIGRIPIIRSHCQPMTTSNQANPKLCFLTFSLLEAIESLMGCSR